LAIRTERFCGEFPDQLPSTLAGDWQIPAQWGSDLAIRTERFCGEREQFAEGSDLAIRTKRFVGKRSVLRESSLGFGFVNPNQAVCGEEIRFEGEQFGVRIWQSEPSRLWASLNDEVLNINQGA